MRVALLLCALSVAGATYLASPFWAAWSVREAIRQGDTATLAGKVEWDSVRASLKASLKSEQANVELQRAEANGRQKPTLWQRITIGGGAGMVDRFFDGAVTPEGLGQMYAARTRAPGATADPSDDPSLSLPSRLMAFLERVESVDYPGFGLFEVTVRDRQHPERRYTGRMVLDGFEWRLLSLTVWSAPGPAAGPASLAASID